MIEYLLTCNSPSSSVASRLRCVVTMNSLSRLLLLLTQTLAQAGNFNTYECDMLSTPLNGAHFFGMLMDLSTLMERMLGIASPMKALSPLRRVAVRTSIRCAARREWLGASERTQPVLFHPSQLSSNYAATSGRWCQHSTVARQPGPVVLIIHLPHALSTATKRHYSAGRPGSNSFPRRMRSSTCSCDWGPPQHKCR